MSEGHEPRLDAAGHTFAVVVSRFNHSITRRLLEGALDGLKRYGCGEGDIEVHWVPGSFELPIVAQKLTGSGKFDVVICLGRSYDRTPPTSISWPQKPPAGSPVSVSIPGSLLPSGS